MSKDELEALFAIAMPNCPECGFAIQRFESFWKNPSGEWEETIHMVCQEGHRTKVEPIVMDKWMFVKKIIYYGVEEDSKVEVEVVAPGFETTITIPFEESDKLISYLDKKVIVRFNGLRATIIYPDAAP
jgi:hypothetical protein